MNEISGKKYTDVVYFKRCRTFLGRTEEKDEKSQ